MKSIVSFILFFTFSTLFAQSSNHQQEELVEWRVSRNDSIIGFNANFQSKKKNVKNHAVTYIGNDKSPYYWKKMHEFLSYNSDNLEFIIQRYKRDANPCLVIKLKNNDSHIYYIEHPQIQINTYIEFLNIQFIDQHLFVFYKENAYQKTNFFAYEINLKGKKIGERKLLGSYDDSENEKKLDRYFSGDMRAKEKRTFHVQYIFNQSKLHLFYQKDPNNQFCVFAAQKENQLIYTILGTDGFTNSYHKKLPQSHTVKKIDQKGLPQLFILKGIDKEGNVFLVSKKPFETEKTIIAYDMEGNKVLEKKHQLKLIQDDVVSDLNFSHNDDQYIYFTGFIYDRKIVHFNKSYQHYNNLTKGACIIKLNKSTQKTQANCHYFTPSEMTQFVGEVEMKKNEYKGFYSTNIGLKAASQSKNHIVLFKEIDISTKELIIAGYSNYYKSIRNFYGDIHLLRFDLESCSFSMNTLPRTQNTNNKRSYQDFSLKLINNDFYVFYNNYEAKAPNSLGIVHLKYQQKPITSSILMTKEMETQFTNIHHIYSFEDGRILLPLIQCNLHSYASRYYKYSIVKLKK